MECTWVKALKGLQVLSQDPIGSKSSPEWEEGRCGRMLVQRALWLYLPKILQIRCTMGMCRIILPS